MGAFFDLTGNRYGRLVVVSRQPNDANRKSMWLCLCDCGTYKVVGGASLTRRLTQSCGCIVREKQSQKKHGDTGKRLYAIWVHMRQRIRDRNTEYYKNYGGRGISICSEWDDYQIFKKWALENGYSDHLTIDRINVNGDYSPENCRWITMKAQSNNKRDNIRLTCEGATLTVAQWAEKFGVTPGALHYRIHQGWDEKRVLTQPFKRYKRK